jgi:hypothetical protein
LFYILFDIYFSIEGIKYQKQHLGIGDFRIDDIYEPMVGDKAV